MVATRGTSTRIHGVDARQILDSRGHPTLEVDVSLVSGRRGRASVPAGASTGRYEAVELRDGGDEWAGRGVRRAIHSVRDTIGPEIVGVDAADRETLDGLLIELDGTSSLGRLGGNAILGVSLAAARAVALGRRLPLWRHVGGSSARTLPIPMLNVLEGGMHADNPLTIQEVLLIPHGAATFSEALRLGAEVYSELGYVLLARGFPRALGEEGGFAPPLGSLGDALDLVVEAIERVDMRPGVDVALGLDVAASELWDGSAYAFDGAQGLLSTKEMIERWTVLCGAYPIASLEDPLGDEDWAGWRALTEQLAGRSVQLVGDDLFATHPSLVQLGIDQRAATAVLVKPNQVGTLTRTLETIAVARGAGYESVMSHRAGETEDTTIADLAVATGCRYIKAGAPAGGRAPKYNRLLRIEEELGDRARFAARSGDARLSGER